VPVGRTEESEVTTTVPFIWTVEVTEETAVPLVTCVVTAPPGTDVTDVVATDELGETDVVVKSVVTFDSTAVALEVALRVPEV
jgi:hypothetical protein